MFTAAKISRTVRRPSKAISQLRFSSKMSSNENPTLIGGHAQYVKGAAEGAIGSVTGSEAWKSSGEQDTKAGIDAMKQASANRDPQASGFGKVEEAAGKAVGCEGMEKEGAESKSS